MANISGIGAPTKQTKGVIGDIYTNTTNGKKYKCTSVMHTDSYDNDYTEYSWELIIEETVNTDDTLIESGTAADSKAVGDKFNEVFESIEELEADDELDAGKKHSNIPGAEIFNDYVNNIVAAPYAHAEGNNTKATNTNAHSEGGSTTASGANSHAEGWLTTASGTNSHAEGDSTTASGANSHAEGDSTTASGANSHAEGWKTTASGPNSHAEGMESKAESPYSHAEGSSKTTGQGTCAHAEGSKTTSSGNGSHAEGINTTSSGDGSHAEGYGSVAIGMFSHAEGYGTIAASVNQHVQGRANIEDKNETYAHIVGNGTVVSGTITARSNAHTLDWDGNAEFAGDVKINACGGKTPVSMAEIATQVEEMSANESAGRRVEGTVYTIDGVEVTANFGAEVFNNYEGNKATGYHAHAEGDSTTATGNLSHAEGQRTTASGVASHAEGMESKAESPCSHAEGNGTKAIGMFSHSEGTGTTANGIASHAEGIGTVASSESQHVQGRYNIEDAEKLYAHIVGNGSKTESSNAHTLDWDGNAWYAGTVEGTAIILKSSTEGSSKRFKITVDDNGTISATDIIE